MTEMQLFYLEDVGFKIRRTLETVAYRKKTKKFKEEIKLLKQAYKWVELIQEQEKNS